jgi:hypothetical protein
MLPLWIQGELDLPVRGERLKSPAVLQYQRITSLALGHFEERDANVARG